ncbi:MAG: DsbA family oxidoreductase [Verrucomicrobiota bacterium]
MLPKVTIQLNVIMDAKVQAEKQSEEAVVDLHIFSDTICPWCLIGKTKLDRALAGISEAGRIRPRWHAFELNPNMPSEGMKRREYRAKKFGSWERSRQLDAEVSAAGEQMGIDFRHDLIEFTPNTRASHRLAWWAREKRQHELVDRLLRAYFCEGLDVGSISVLAELAGQVGLDQEAAFAFLKTSEGNDEVAYESATAQQAGVRGVPAILSGGKLVFSGAQPVAEIRSRLIKLLETSGENT